MYANNSQINKYYVGIEKDDSYIIIDITLFVYSSFVSICNKSICSVFRNLRNLRHMLYNRKAIKQFE